MNKRLKLKTEIEKIRELISEVDMDIRMIEEQLKATTDERLCDRLEDYIFESLQELSALKYKEGILLNNYFYEMSKTSEGVHKPRRRAEG